MFKHICHFFPQKLVVHQCFCFALSVTKGEINFHKAAKENDLESVRKLLSEHRINVNCKNNVRLAAN